jgi:hypothetical protein
MHCDDECRKKLGNGKDLFSYEKAGLGPPPTSPWKETVDPASGKVYYYNGDTKETRWERPSELGPVQHSLKATAAAVQPAQSAEPLATGECVPHSSLEASAKCVGGGENQWVPCAEFATAAMCSSATFGCCHWESSTRVVSASPLLPPEVIGEGETGSWLRSIAQHAPWARRIHVLLDGGANWNVRHAAHLSQVPVSLAGQLQLLTNHTSIQPL